MIGERFASTRAFGAAWIASGLLAISAPRTAIAAEPPAPSATAATGNNPAGGDGRSADRLRGEVQERVRALRAWRIVEELKLDESASARLFPILAKYDQREMALAADRREIVKALRAELAMPKPDDARLTKQIDRLLANRAQRRGLHDERIKELRRVLNPVQQAKLALLLPRLEAELASLMHEVAGGRGTDLDTPGP